MFNKFLVVVALLIAATVARAETPITLNLGGGYWLFDSERRLEDAGTPWLSLEYAFNDQWAAEIFYAEDDSKYKNGPDVDVTTWQVDMLYYGGSYIGAAGKIRPFIAVGAGEIDIDADTYDTVETTFNAGAGLRWMLTDRLGARFEARWLNSLDEEKNDFMMLAGINYYFGKVKEAPVAVAATAPGDADGDGVTDDKDKCPDTPAGMRVNADGCTVAIKTDSFELNVEFDFDSAKVRTENLPEIGALAKFLDKHQGLTANIEGHTDSTGSDDYNQGLSQRRAQSVVDVLVNDNGVPASRLNAQGYGETRPIASNDTKDGRAMNRRVMTTLEAKTEVVK